MKLRSNRAGAVEPITLTLLIVVGLFIGFPKLKGFFHRDATKPVVQVEQLIEKKQVQIDQTEKGIVKDAQADVRATGMALESGNVPLATEFNTRAYGKLTTVVGGLDPKTERELRELVTKLESKVETIEAQGRKDLAERDAKSDAQIAKLAKQEAELTGLGVQLKGANDKLKVAYTKAEEDAAAYQNLQFIFRLSLVVGGIALFYAFYTRFFTVGGIFKRIGATLNDSGNAEIVQHLDANLDTWMQNAVAKARKLGKK